MKIWKRSQQPYRLTVAPRFTLWIISHIPYNKKGQKVEARTEQQNKTNGVEETRNSQWWYLDGANEATRQPQKWIASQEKPPSPHPPQAGSQAWLPHPSACRHLCRSCCAFQRQTWTQWTAETCQHSIPLHLLPLWQRLVTPSTWTMILLSCTPQGRASSLTCHCWKFASTSANSSCGFGTQFLWKSSKFLPPQNVDPGEKA